MEDETWIAVWLPVDNPFPFFKEDGLERDGAFAQAAGKLLAAEELGYFEGAMTGHSNVNLSFTLNPKGNAERAIQIVTEALKEWKYEEQAIVAHQGFVTTEGEARYFENAAWPPGFTGELPR